MSYRGSTGAFPFVVALMLSMGGAWAADDAKYPNWKGHWDPINPRLGGQAIKFDPTKAWGPAQQAPLTPEYQKVHEESMADQANGGLGNYPTARCLPSGMPRLMALPVQEYVITSETTYILVGHDIRRIFTDGRDWPKDAEPAFLGYSIGKWVDEDGDGKFDVLEVETRGMKGPRSFDASGLPLHVDNDSVVKERIYLDKSNRDVLIDEVTTLDKALTRPWTVTKKYVRETKNVIWFEYNCTENNRHVQIGKDNYYVSADGFLMPVRKGQAPPDLKYFQNAQQ